MKQKHMSRAGRKAQILKELYVGSFAQSPKSMSVYGIAKAIGMSHSMHLKRIVFEMMLDGWVQQWVLNNGVRGMTQMYMITPEAYEKVFNAIQTSNTPFEDMKIWFEQ